MNKKVNTLVILSFLLVIVLASAYAFSKYRTDVNGEAKAEVANWSITVNGCNVVNPDKNNTACFSSEVVDEEVKVTRNFGIDDIDYSNNGNDNVVGNKIAPGSSGTFKIKIKPNDTEVSIKYTLKTWINYDNSSIKLSRSDPNSTNKVELEKDGYVGYINYDPNNKDYEEEIIIYVDWENDEKNNLLDTVIGTAGSAPVLDVPVEIVFEQYKG